ncbi:MAG: hypothetical protein ACR2NN_00800 [Bryobacteraceae bacterium]
MAAGVTHGFLLSGGQYTTIDFPGTNGTELYGINPQGDMTGVYTLAGARHRGRDSRHRFRARHRVEAGGGWRGVVHFRFFNLEEWRFGVSVGLERSRM